MNQQNFGGTVVNWRQRSKPFRLPESSLSGTLGTDNFDAAGSTSSGSRCGDVIGTLPFLLTPVTPLIAFSNGSLHTILGFDRFLASFSQ
jgi:hypothetical protein